MLRFIALTNKSAVSYPCTLAKQYQQSVVGKPTAKPSMYPSILLMPPSHSLTTNQASSPYEIRNKGSYTDEFQKAREEFCLKMMSDSPVRSGCQIRVREEAQTWS